MSVLGKILGRRDLVDIPTRVRRNSGKIYYVLPEDWEEGDLALAATPDYAVALLIWEANEGSTLVEVWVSNDQFMRI